MSDTSRATLTRYTSMGVVFKCKGNGSVEKEKCCVY